MCVAHEPLKTLVVRAHHTPSSHQQVSPLLQRLVQPETLLISDRECLLVVGEFVRLKGERSVRVRVVSNLSLSEHHTHAAHGRRVDVDIE